MNPSPCLPFILTSMGGLRSEGHEFLRLCRKRNPVKAELLLDVLVTQHSRWTARRVHRALFGQTLIDFSGDSWTCLTTHCITSKISNRCQHRQQTNQTHILSNFTRKFSCTKRSEIRVDASDDDECSANSNFDSSDETHHESTGNEIPSWLHAMAFTDEQKNPVQESISDCGGASASAACDLFVQPNFERQAFPAASEDSVQTSILTSDHTAHRETEFFELSPE